jgi:RimJ/RimL family protein N-acetyltransferase
MAWDESKVRHINTMNTTLNPNPPPTPSTTWSLRDGTTVIIKNGVRIDPAQGPILGDTPHQDPANEHFYLCRTLCKQHRYTKSFDGLMFSRMEFYERSEIRVMVDLQAKSELNPHGIIGFSNFYHKIRTPATKIYFFVTDKDHLRRGVAGCLFEDMVLHMPLWTKNPRDPRAEWQTRYIELDVNKTNPPAIAFWERLGFTVQGSSCKDTCYYMTRPRKGEQA